ncbi:MAG: nodulation protein NoeA [Legionellales bacterium]|nr:nodulation protein NoeA [Legionellales bacterium]
MLEHERVPYVSYPYEWCFYQLKDAALHHIDFQLYLLQNDVVLKDASAYNIQFIGAKPVFIDLLSLASYQQGEYWLGYRQFCTQFLNPLLLRSILGITHNSWFRGNLEGVPTSDIALMLPLRKKFNWKIFTHILLQNYFDKVAIKNEDNAMTKASSQKGFSKLAYEGLLRQMRKWVSRLEPKGNSKTYWGRYAHTNIYDSDEAIKKKQFIAEFTSTIKPELLIDLGCNTGDYSIISLEHGAESVVGFDFDQTSLELAYQRSKTLAKPFLPLFLDAANPSPAQGWLQSERCGFNKRAKADAMIALAFIHHLAVAKNIPLAQLVQWLLNIAPQGIIEFIPKEDITVIKMLALRKDIFADYNQDNFELILSQHTKIIKKEIITKSGRTLYWHQKNELAS